jgi:hypothetical protein
MISIYPEDFSAVSEMNESSERGTQLEVPFKFKSHVFKPSSFPTATNASRFVFSNETRTASPPNVGAMELLTSIYYSNREELPKSPSTRAVKPLLTDDSVVSLQKWEGQVLQILSNGFTARLTDLTDQGGKEDAEFSISELSPDDLSLLEPGAVFYWTIGRHTDPTNRQRTVSELRFRRLPNWTEDELAQASLEADKLAIQFGIK